MVDRNQSPRVISEPCECFVRMQLVRNGVFVRARIFRRLGFLVGEINDTPVDDIFQIWHSGNLITQEEYDAMHVEPNPYRVVHISAAGLADRVREAEENDFWWWRDFA